MVEDRPDEEVELATAAAAGTVDCGSAAQRISGKKRGITESFMVHTCYGSYSIRLSNGRGIHCRPRHCNRRRGIGAGVGR